MTVSSRYSHFKDFSKHDTALVHYEKKHFTHDEVTFFYHKKLMFNKECYSPDLIDKFFQPTRQFYVVFNQQEEALKTSEFQAFLRAKRKIFKEQLEDRIGFEWSQHFSFFQLFVEWTCEMIDLYKLNNPKDSQVEEDQLILLSKLATWELERNKPGVKESLNETLQIWFAKLKESMPQSEEFCSMWSAFSQLLFDDNPRWNPTILVMELEDYLQKDYRKPIVDLRKIKRVFERVIPLTHFRKMWSHACVSASGNWRRIIPYVLDLCGNSFARDIAKAAETLSPRDAHLVKRMLSIWYLALNEFLNVEHKNIPEMLDVLGKCPIESLESHESFILQMRSYYVTYSHERLFPNALDLTDAEELRQISLVGWDDPIKVTAILHMHRQVVRYSHQLLNTFTSLPIHEVSHLYEVAQRIAVAIKEEERRKEIIISFKPTSVSSVQKPLKLHSGKENKVNTVSPKVTKKKVSNAASSSATTIHVVQTAVTTEHIATLSFRTLLSTSPSIAQQNAAAHADLYRYFVTASQSLLQRFGDSPEHALNIQRLGHHTAGTAYETALQFKGSLAEKEFKIVGHNLWPLYKKVPFPAIESAIEQLHLVSSCVRYTHDQHVRAQHLQMKVHKRSSVLAQLMAVRGDDLENAIEPLKAILSKAAEHVDQIATAIGCKTEQRSKDEVYVEGSSAIFKGELDTLIQKVKLLEGRNLWVKQWCDDLLCLKSTYELLCLGQSLGERALLIGHLHLMLHASVQSGIYALLMVQGKKSTTEHNLINLWVQIEGDKSKETILKKWLENANGVSRYPFTYKEVQSPLHRIQLEEITRLFRPETNDGFMLSGPTEENSLVETLGWCPYLKKISTVQEQQTIIEEAMKEVCALLTQDLLPKFS